MGTFKPGDRVQIGGHTHLAGTVQPTQEYVAVKLDGAGIQGNFPRWAVRPAEGSTPEYEQIELARRVLDCPMEDNDADAHTVRDYLAKLALMVWQENEGFSGKRPFGNSGWEHEVYDALADAKLIDREDDQEGDRLIELALGVWARGDL